MLNDNHTNWLDLRRKCRNLEKVPNKISASNTDHGAAIHDSLLENGGITEVTKEEEENGHSIMPDNLLEQANMMYNQQPTRSHENKLVNLYTPILMQVVAEVDLDLRLVNSENFRWLRCMSGHSKSDLKPDLFSAHYSLIQFCSPYKDAPACTVNRLFGKFIGWNNLSSIHCIWDAKWKIDM